MPRFASRPHLAAALGLKDAPSPFALPCPRASGPFGRQLGAVALAGCAPAVDVAPRQDAANPACAPMMVALPDAIGDAALRKTNSQATAAWGDPSQVILRCGVNVPGPTTDRCVSVNGIDWVIKEGDSGLDPDHLWPRTRHRDPDGPGQDQLRHRPGRPRRGRGKVPASRNCVGQEELQNLPTSQ